MILFDTSIWVEHLSRKLHAPLRDALEDNEVIMHPMVLGELLLGGVPSSIELALFALPRIAPASSEQVYELIRKFGWQAKGIGWVDAHLLSSVYAGALELHTLDKRLAKLARGLT